MRNWALIFLLYGSVAWSIAPAWDTLIADLPFVLHTTVEVQGVIRQFPDEKQNLYFQALRNALGRVKSYGDSLPGPHVFRWPDPRARFVPKGLQFYFSDQDRIETHFPHEPPALVDMIRQLGIRGAVRQSYFRNCDYYMLQVPLDFHLYDRRTGDPNEFGFLNLASYLAGHLYGSFQGFLEIDYQRVRRYSPETAAHYAAFGRRSREHSANFLRWLQRQPNFPNFPIEQREEVARRIASFSDDVFNIATPPSDPDPSSCGTYVAN